MPDEKYYPPGDHILFAFPSLSTTILEVDRAILNVRTLFPPKNREKIHILIKNNDVDYLLAHPISQHVY